MDQSLIAVIKETELEPTKAEIIIGKFSGFLEEARKWEADAKSIVVTDASQTVEIKKARTARLALKAIRVNAENVRKALKEQSLREGRAIDGIANIIKAVIVPIEEHLEKQEKFVEAQEELAREKLTNERIAQLQQYVPDVTLYNLKDMSEAGFNELLANSKFAFEARKEAEKKAEDERVAKEKAAAEEQEKTKAENARLKAEAEAREKAAKEERAEQERLLAVEREKSRKEAEAREKAEADLKAKQEADAKAKRDEEARLEKERKAKLEADRQAALAPDKEKVVAFAEQIKALKAPRDLSEKAQAIVDKAEGELLIVAHEIIKAVKNI